MKKFGKILAMVMVALMMMSVVAFAEDAATEEPITATLGDEQIVTVKLTGLTKGEEATILAVNQVRINESEVDGETVKTEETVELASLKNTDIVYIDQLTVADDGTVTFTLDASNAVANLDGEQYVDFYCGYTSMNVGDEPMGCTLLINPSDDPEIIYGDVNDDKYVTTDDCILILRKVLGADVTLGPSA